MMERLYTRVLIHSISVKTQCSLAPKGLATQLVDWTKSIIFLLIYLLIYIYIYIINKVDQLGVIEFMKLLLSELYGP